MSFANVTIAGHLGKDAEQVTMTNTGNLLTKFSIAVNAGYGDKEVVNWYDCVIFGERGTKLLQHLTKGKEVIVNGELKATKREHEGKTYFGLNVNVQQLSFVSSNKTEDKSTVSDDDVPF